MGRLPSDTALARICRGELTAQNRAGTHPLVTTADRIDLPVHAMAVLFDAGDILYDATAWWRWVVQLLAHFDVHTTFDTSYHVWQREYLQQVRCGSADYWGAFAKFLRSVGMRPAQIQEALAASQPRHQQLHDRIRPLPEVASTLARLQARGLRLGVANHSVSNGDGMTERLADASLAHFFDFVVTTGDANLLVPTAEFYGQAAQKFSDQADPFDSGNGFDTGDSLCSASAVVFVGHDVEELLLAKSAGLTTIACNHRHGVHFDVAIDRFARLVEIIRPARPLRKAG